MKRKKQRSIIYSRFSINTLVDCMWHLCLLPVNESTNIHTSLLLKLGMRIYKYNHFLSYPINPLIINNNKIKDTKSYVYIYMYNVHFQKQQNKIALINNSDLLQCIRKNKPPTYLDRCILVVIVVIKRKLIVLMRWWVH
jgi:hypothetical protein